MRLQKDLINSKPSEKCSLLFPRSKKILAETDRIISREHLYTVIKSKRASSPPKILLLEKKPHARKIQENR